MKERLKDYFYFTNKEFNGILFLLVMLLIVITLPSLYAPFKPVQQVDFKKLESAIIQLKQFEQEATAFKKPSTFSKKQQSNNQIALHSFDPNTATKIELMELGLYENVAQAIINYRTKVKPFEHKTDVKKIYTLKAKDYNRLEPYIQIKASPKQVEDSKKKTIPTTIDLAKIQYVEFDPNTASKEIFIQLGLAPKVAQSIINYRSKGGQFRKPIDFKKIYGLQESDYQRLEQYIIIKEQFAKREIPKSYNNYTKKKPISFEKIEIDINTATVEDWKTLRGIGATYAKRIVKYRKSLGGFIDKAQLLNVYGLSDSTYQNIEPFLILKNQDIAKININTTTAKALKSHPYISWKEANAIIKYRKQHGAFSKTTDLSKIRSLKPQKVKELLPYLTVD